VVAPLDPRAAAVSSDSCFISSDTAVPYHG
jgi:hypothetical protein